MLAICTALVLHGGNTLLARSSNAARPTVDSGSFVDRYLEVAEEIDPMLADQLRSMCQLDPGHFGRVLRRLGPRLGELVDMRQTDPALFQRKIHELHLEAAIESLAASIRMARALGDPPDPGTDAQLRGLVEAQLAATLRTRRHLLERMRAELADAESELDREAAEFSAEVGQRVEALLSR
jgi:hypothetical protein